MKNNTELKVATGADPVLYESETLSGMLIRFVEIKRDQYKWISNSERVVYSIDQISGSRKVRDSAQGRGTSRHRDTVQS